MRLLAAFGLAATLAAMALPVQAQNAGQVHHAQGGASCPGCNLFQADFSGAELKGRNYSGARLRQADMSMSVMNGTRFTGSDLRDVEAYGGVFTGASFARANLTHASFVGTYLQGANFGGANLEGANFSGAEMDHAVGLTQGQLSRACGDDTTRLPRGLRIPPC
jgi:uncharacterized protein YjbI with pentapeptide repeats